MGGASHLRDMRNYVRDLQVNVVSAKRYDSIVMGGVMMVDQLKTFLENAKAKAEDKEEFEDVEVDTLRSLGNCRFDKFMRRIFDLYNLAGYNEKELKDTLIPDLFREARKAWNRQCRL